MRLPINSKDRLPNVLLIGAMKSGTTTLSRDLRQHPKIFVPECKEVGHLRYDSVLTKGGRTSYVDFYRFAKADQLRVDASTGYSLLPRYEGVPRRAYEVCGPDTRILYIVREPMSRIVSHHAHVFFKEGLSADVNEAIRQTPDFIDFSRYAMQIEAWLEHFSPDNLRVIELQGYRQNRQATMDAVFAFLGLETVALKQPDTVYNRAAERRLVSGVVYRFAVSKTYEAYLQRMLPKKLRRLAQELLTKPAPTPDCSKLAADAKEWIRDQLRADHDRFSSILGLAGSPWDASGLLTCRTAQKIYAPTGAV